MFKHHHSPLLVFGFGLAIAAAPLVLHAQQVVPGKAPAYAEKNTTPPAFIPAPSNAAPKTDTATPPALAPLTGTGGDQEIDITADQSLEWNENDRTYTARGNARAKRGDVTIEADVLKAYDRKKSDGSSEVWKLAAEGRVRITGKDSLATGEAAVYDIDTRKAVLTGKSLTLKTPTDTVTAEQSLEYWEKEAMALARGNATAHRDGRDVRADELIAYMEKNAKGDQDISRMEARGGVKIVTKEDAILCDQVNYDLVRNAATLTGNVSITRGKNQLRGDRVETDFKTGKSRLLGSGKTRVHALISASKGTPLSPASGAKKTPSAPSPRPAAH